MPLVDPSSYRGAPWYQPNGHLQTILPSTVRRMPPTPWQRERLTLSDGDFVDLDWWTRAYPRLLVLSHGLEGNSSRLYMRGMAHYFHTNGWDVLAWNCRSCSGEMNRKLRLYHHGEIRDVSEVLEHAFRNHSYQRAALIGFSMGGSITLKYLGVKGKELPGPIDRAVAFSTPCDLASSVQRLEEPANRFYKRRFFKQLLRKVQYKARQFPGVLDLSKLEEVREWKDFDEHFSIRINGFSSADAFYENASCNNYLEGIKIPALLVNAWNDPILAPACFPAELARKHPFFELEAPSTGGHVGFTETIWDRPWSERRALDFCQA